MVAPQDERIQVSMRVPANVARAVQRYAVMNDMRKTDAYVHFLKRGLTAESKATSIEGRLDKIIALLEERL